MICLREYDSLRQCPFISLASDLVFIEKHFLILHQCTLSNICVEDGFQAENLFWSPRGDTVSSDMSSTSLEHMMKSSHGHKGDHNKFLSG